MTAPNQPVKLGHIPALDGIRGLCILGVVVHHVFAPALVAGATGVDTFFVLSGFLITTLLAQEWQSKSSISLARFYARRVLRLAPAFFAVILASIILVLLLEPPTVHHYLWDWTLPCIFYVSNWAAMDPHFIGLGPLGLTWSLAVEDQFYLLWPPLLVFMLTRKLQQRTIIGVLIGAIVVSAAICFPIWLTSPNYMRTWGGTDTRSHQLLIGCVLGLLFVWGKLPSARVISRLLPYVLTILACYLVAHNFTPSDWVPIPIVGGYALFAICVACILAYLLVVPESKVHKALSWKPLRWVGAISYGLYLWHGVIFWMVRTEMFNVSPVIVNTARVVLSFLAAAASYYFLERHFLRLKVKFEPTRTKADEGAIIPMLAAPILQEPAADEPMSSKSPALEKQPV